MHSTGTANEELSTFLDGVFTRDWTLDMHLDNTAETTYSFENPVDYSLHPSGVAGVVAEIDSECFIPESSTFSKDCYWNTAPLNSYHPDAMARDGVLTLQDPFLTDPLLLESVPEADPLAQNTVLSMEYNRPFDLELSETFGNTNSFQGFPSFSPVLLRSYSLESDPHLFHSRLTNESDSNSSHESNFQSLDSMLNSRNSPLVLSSTTVLQEQLSTQTVFPSTVLSPVSRQKILVPSLLESSNQTDLNSKTDQSLTSKTITTGAGKTSTESFSFQSLPEIKLPCLPDITSPVQGHISQWSGSGLTGIFLGRVHEQDNQMFSNLSPMSTEGGRFQPLQTVQSTGNLSCISTNTSGESINGGKNLDNKSATKNALASKFSPEERQLKVLRYKQKRTNRKFNRGVTYQCRKTLADSRPRVRGRFAKNNDIDSTIPPKKSDFECSVDI
eukprot:g663.t1